MNDIKTIDQQILKLRIKCIIIFEFLNLYNKFELTIRSVFENHIKNFDKTLIQKLYFYSGGHIGSYIDYPSNTIKLNSLEYKKDYTFKDLTINQIVKIIKQEEHCSLFKYEIQSLQTKQTVYSYLDCTIKLINMRNILSHELAELKFKDKDLIELLSIENLKKQEFPMLLNYDLEIMDDMTKYIASNIVYMRIMLEKITKN